jgi:hypothetical protein
MEWTKKAACRKANYELFFSYDTEETDQAKKICEKCEVRKPCFLSVSDSSCVTAGTTRYDRLCMMWGRVDGIGQSNWNKSSEVFSGLFKDKK